MEIDTTQFPAVWWGARATPGWESTLDGLLQQDDAFVLLTRAFAMDRAAWPSAEAKHLALWIKRNRSLFRQRCAGSVVVVSSVTAATALRPLLPPLSKVFGVPLRIVTEHQVQAEVASLSRVGSPSGTTRGCLALPNEPLFPF